MQDVREKDAADSELRGLRVLALPVSAIPIKPLLLAKDVWNWNVDLVRQGKPRKVYEQLVAPAGQIFVVPRATERQLWEDDPREVAATDQLICEIERASGIPAGQVLLADASAVGSRFAAPVARLTDVYSLSLPAKADNPEPYNVLRRVFRFADQVVESASPDLIYAFELASPWSYTVWLAAKRRGIPCVIVRRSKIQSDHGYVTTDRLMLNTAAMKLAEAKRSARADVSDAAVAYIRQFRDQPKMVNYIQAKRERRAAQSVWRKWHAEWLWSTLLKARDVLARRSEARELARAGRSLFEFNRRRYMSRRHRRYLRTFGPDELAAMKYIFFSVHKETDMSLYLQASPWFDQRNTIRLLASVLPNCYRLLVREHPDNYGLRPSRYYRELLGLPNVVLIDANDAQFKYIENANLVVTENGSTGWEGLLFQRRVLAVAPSFYDGVGRAVKLDKLDDLGATIVAMLSNPPVSDPEGYDLDLGRMIDAERESCFRLQDTETALDHISAVIRPHLGHNKQFKHRLDGRQSCLRIASAAHIGRT